MVIGAQRGGCIHTAWVVCTLWHCIYSAPVCVVITELLDEGGSITYLTIVNTEYCRAENISYSSRDSVQCC